MSLNKLSTRSASSMFPRVDISRCVYETIELLAVSDQEYVSVPHAGAQNVVGFLRFLA